ADVFRRVGIKQGFDEESPDTGRAGDAVRVAAARHDKAFDATALAEDEIAVGCEGRPALADAGLLGALSLGKKSRKACLEVVQNLPVGGNGGRGLVECVTSR